MSIDVSKESKLDPKYRKIYRLDDYILTGYFEYFHKYHLIKRAMIEKGNKLDEIYKSPDSFSKIFQSETTLEREK